MGDCACLKGFHDFGVHAKKLLAQLANDWDADDDEEHEAQPALAAAVAGAGVL